VGTELLSLRPSGALASSHYGSKRGSECKWIWESSGSVLRSVDADRVLTNAVNGEAESFYEMPPDFVGSALGYLGYHEFLDYQVKNRKPIVVRATTFP
jgi:hypothetical protein